MYAINTRQASKEEKQASCVILCVSISRWISAYVMLLNQVAYCSYWLRLHFTTIINNISSALTGRGPTSSLFILAKRQASRQRSKQAMKNTSKQKRQASVVFTVCQWFAMQASNEEKQASCVLLCVSYAYSQCIFCICNVISEASILVCKALGKQAKINKQAMNARKQRRKSKQAVFCCVSVFRNNFCVCYVT